MWNVTMVEWKGCIHKTSGNVYKSGQSVDYENESHSSKHVELPIESETEIQPKSLKTMSFFDSEF